HAESKFRIGSVTKQFTAVAILQLMERGKLHLNDSIQKFLPNFPVKKHTTTIEHLLTHTSGLKEVTELEVFSTDLMLKGIDPELLINYFKDYPLEFEPGTEFRYSNSGYHLLGLIVQKVSGMEYNKYIKKNLFEPAGMENSMAGDNRELISNRVSGYEKANSSIVNAAYLDMSIPFSAGNLLSTTSDINKWYKALFQYQLIPEGTLEKALTPYRFKDSSSSKYGYGWFIDSLQGEKVVSH
ncbi:serine hydrolase domain-containing protein, partial [Longispora fulva]|uniref:serine hydrolase domain-containing protein n=1 Tax=Longispora fulva TaxID=619741 RepID=UPI003637B6FC